MTFWESLKESFLDWHYGGAWQREQMRWNAEQQKECERIINKEYEEYRRSLELT